MNKAKAKSDAEKEWRALLTNPERKGQFFDKLCDLKDADHSHVKYIKHKIDKLVKQELEFLGFQNQLSKEESEALASKAYDEVHTKSNFYFTIDENKKERNLKVYNVKAPGNIHRHPSVMLPHEHVHI